MNLRGNKLMMMALAAMLTLSTAPAGAEESHILRLSNAAFDQQTALGVPGPDGAHAEGGGFKRTGPGAAELAAVSLSGNRAVVESAEAVGIGALGGGGSLSCFESLLFSNGRLTDNLASTQNGAFAHGGGLDISMVGRSVLTGMEFSRNTVQVDGTGHTTCIAGHAPSAGARGGALSVYNQGRDEPAFVPSELMFFSIAGAVFDENSAMADGQATAALGGAVAVIGHIDAQFDGSALTGITFSGNKAVAGPASGGGAEGGAVAVIGNPFRPLSGDLPPTAVFTKTAFDGNSVLSQVIDNESMDARGGAVSLMTLNGKALFRDCRFTGNRLETAVAESSKGRGRARGGAIFSNNGLVIENSSFKNNSGTSPGSALGGALEVGGTQSVIRNSHFEANIAQGGVRELGSKYKGPVAGFGGAVYLNGQLTIADSSFRDNRAAGLVAQGGAVFVGPRARLTVVDSSFTGNQAIGPEAAGGAIYVAPGGKLVFGVSEGRTMTLSGNKAGPSPNQARPSGIFLAPPAPDAKQPEASPDGRPPRPEPDDLVINIARGAELILRDPIDGVKARITKNGPGIFSLAGTSLAAAWNINGSLKLMADEQGQGAVIKAAEKISVAGAAALILEPAVKAPHVLEAAGLELPAEFKVTLADRPDFPGKHVILKLKGDSDFKNLAGQGFSGTMTVGESLRDYRLDWNDKGELTFIPGQSH